MSGLVDPGGQPYGPNRQVRRQVLRELARPAHDLICTKLGAGHIYIGLKGSGYVRLDHHKARQLLDELTRLVEEVSAEPDLAVEVADVGVGGQAEQTTTPGDTEDPTHDEV